MNQKSKPTLPRHFISIIRILYFTEEIKIDKNIFISNLTCQPTIFNNYRPQTHT